MFLRFQMGVDPDYTESPIEEPNRDCTTVSLKACEVQLDPIISSRFSNALFKSAI